MMWRWAKVPWLGLRQIQFEKLYHCSSPCRRRWKQKVRRKRNCMTSSCATARGAQRSWLPPSVPRKRKIVQLQSDLEHAQKDRESAKKAMAEAKMVREKEAGAFASFKSDYDTNIAAIEKAVAALEKGMGGSFLQTSTATILRKLAIDMEMSDLDRQDLTSFLSGKQTSGYAPQSGQITGILKQMGDTMKKSLADSTAAE